jgi:RHS repeat-associated protein
VAYAPHSGYNSLTLGNQLVPTFAYNSRLQTANWHTLLYGDPAEDYMSGVLDWGAAPNNNGSLRAITETNDGPSYPSHLIFNQVFTYDKTNRLLSATDDGGWSRQFAYDQFGNMWMPSYTGIPPQGGTVASVNNYDPATNRVNGVPYDTAGNMTGLTGMTLLYDAENRQKIARQTIYGEMDYLYDGNGQRVEKKYPDTSFGIYVYDAQGQLAAEYYSDNAPVPPCSTCYLSWDHLSSTRLITDHSGNLVTRHDFLPFGEEIASGSGGRNSEFGQSDIVNQKFTGQEHDSESGPDFFSARYLSAVMGRFTSADGPLENQDPGDLQSLNLYGYVHNNPLSNIDPSGNACFYSGSGDVNDSASYSDDNSGGQNCSDAFSPQENNKPSATVNGHVPYDVGEQAFVGFTTCFSTVKRAVL